MVNPDKTLKNAMVVHRPTHPALYHGFSYNERHLQGNLLYQKWLETRVKTDRRTDKPRSIRESDSRKRFSNRSIHTFART